MKDDKSTLTPDDDEVEAHRQGGDDAEGHAVQSRPRPEEDDDVEAHGMGLGPLDPK